MYQRKSLKQSLAYVKWPTDDSPRYRSFQQELLSHTEYIVKKLIISFFFSLLTANAAQASTSMNYEGSCNGTLANNAPISFKYYSDFDGCKEKSTAAISYNDAGEDRGLVTGTRTLKVKDIYNFAGNKLTFENSTGNTSGSLSYQNEETGEREEVIVQCEVREYSYAEEC